MSVQNEHVTINNKYVVAYTVGTIKSKSVFHLINFSYTQILPLYLLDIMDSPSLRYSKFSI